MIHILMFMPCVIFSPCMWVEIVACFYGKDGGMLLPRLPDVIQDSILLTDSHSDSPRWLEEVISLP